MPQLIGRVLANHRLNRDFVHRVVTVKFPGIRRGFFEAIWPCIQSRRPLVVA